MEGNASVLSTLFSCRICCCKCALRVKALKDFSKDVKCSCGNESIHNYTQYVFIVASGYKTHTT